MNLVCFFIFHSDLKFFFFLLTTLTQILEKAVTVHIFEQTADIEDKGFWSKKDLTRRTDSFVSPNAKKILLLVLWFGAM